MQSRALGAQGGEDKGDSAWGVEGLAGGVLASSTRGEGRGQGSLERQSPEIPPAVVTVPFRPVIVTKGDPLSL